MIAVAGVPGSRSRRPGRELQRRDHPRFAWPAGKWITSADVAGRREVTAHASIMRRRPSRRSVQNVRPLDVVVADLMTERGLDDGGKPCVSRAQVLSVALKPWGVIIFPVADPPIWWVEGVSPSSRIRRIRIGSALVSTSS